MEDVAGRLNSYRRTLIKWSKKGFPNNQKLVDKLKIQLEDRRSGNYTEEKAAEAERLVGLIADAWKNEERY